MKSEKIFYCSFFIKETQKNIYFFFDARLLKVKTDFHFLNSKQTIIPFSFFTFFHWPINTLLAPQAIHGIRNRRFYRLETYCNNSYGNCQQSRQYKNTCTHANAVIVIH